MHITDELWLASVPGGLKQCVLFFGSALGSYLTSKDEEELGLYKLGFVTCACLSFQLPIHLSELSKPCQKIMRRWFGVWLKLGLDPVCKPVLITFMLHKETGTFCNRNYSRIETDPAA